MIEHAARNRTTPTSRAATPGSTSRAASVLPDLPEEIVTGRRSSPRLRGLPPALEGHEKINARKSLGTPKYKKLIQKRRMKKQFERVQDDYQEDDSSSSDESEEEEQDEEEEEDGDGYEDDIEDTRKAASTPGSNKRSAASTPGSSGKRLKTGPGKFVRTPQHHVAVSSSKILSEDYFRDLSTAKRGISNNTCMHSFLLTIGDSLPKMTVAELLSTLSEVPVKHQDILADRTEYYEVCKRFL
jgi:hypothetical protein